LYDQKCMTSHFRHSIWKRLKCAAVQSAMSYRDSTCSK